MATVLPPELVVGAPCYRCRQIAATRTACGDYVDPDKLMSTVKAVLPDGVECSVLSGRYVDTHPYTRWLAALKWYKEQHGDGICAEYPHRCPRCAGPAYVGFNSVDCQAKCETRPALTKETAPCKMGGNHVWQIQVSGVTGQAVRYCAACDVVP